MSTKFIQTPFFSPRDVSAIDTIVIHHTGSNKVGGTIRWFTDIECHRNKATGKIENKVSAHYVIPREPYQGYDLVQCAKHEDIAWHAGRSKWTYANGVTKSYLNKNSIGIELAGDGNVEDYTDFQYKVLIDLLKELVEKYGIPHENILGHEDIAPKRKVDPGKFFDWEKVRKGLNTTSFVMDPITITPADDPRNQDLSKIVKQPEVDADTGDEEFFMESGEDKSPLLIILNLLRGLMKVLINKK